jgi:GTP-binding protein HflX
LAGTDLLADAMPFATLDPTTRRIDLPEGYSLFLTDTVGFIRRLPTQLVAAFRSTLEEVVFADFVIHMVDVSHPNWEMQRDAVMETMVKLEAGDKRMITVFNKIDLATDPFMVRQLAEDWPNCVLMSAKTGQGIDEFMAAITAQVQDLLGRTKALVPYSESSLVQECYDFGRIHKIEYTEEGILIEAELVAEMRSRLKRFQVE